MNRKNYHSVISLNFPQGTSSTDLLHGVFLTSIDDKLKRSVSQNIIRFTMRKIKTGYPQVDMFSIQLQSQEISLTAFGFYRFDKALIFSVWFSFKSKFGTIGYVCVL